MALIETISGVIGNSSDWGSITGGTANADYTRVTKSPGMSRTGTVTIDRTGVTAFIASREYP